MVRQFWAWLAPLALLAASAVPAQEPPADTAGTAPLAVSPAPAWDYPPTDLVADPDFVFGKLDSGMRYVVRRNDTPANQAQVRLVVNAGSLNELDDEQGFAHFVEHMAFNGSERVPEGEMVRLLEREGLAFGADTNASTSFDVTIYRLDLPRADETLLDTSLMLMRETASALTFDRDAVARERGVILSERRVRDTYMLQNTVNRFEFLYPDSRLARRMPIGTITSLQVATSEGLQAFWRRYYRPDNVALVIVGAFDPSLVEAKIAEHFADWKTPEAPLEEMPGAGPVDPDLAGATSIHLHPALPERVLISRNGGSLDEPDSIETRKQGVMRQVAYGIINRRLQRLTRSDDPPFRDAGVGTSDVVEAGRTTNIIVESKEGEWRRGMIAAVIEYRRSLTFGFTQQEIDEQLANLRTAIENAQGSASTRPNSAFTGAAITFLQDEIVPTTPEAQLERFNVFVPDITPENVMLALLTELVSLEDPLIRFEGASTPEGGEAALRATWDEAMAAELVPPKDRAFGEFGYDSFGEPGSVVSDTVEPRLGIRQVQFNNGVRLNLKQTDLERDRIRLELNVDGGAMLNTRENPHATAMVSVLHVGGLGLHDYDELQTMLAGKSVGFRFASNAETFRMQSITTPRDLELQMTLIAAALSDPGYRPQAEAQYRRYLSNFFARRNATPSSALSNALGGILSDGDPRFTTGEEETYRALTIDGLRAAISDRLEQGALEIALVGDIDEQQAIEIVGATVGALPHRETDFQPYTENRQRPFTSRRDQHIVRHSGATDQAIVYIVWPTRDGEDLAQSLELELLQRMMRLALTDKLREELGQTYSPGANASQSRVWPGYGTFSISAQVDTAQVDAAREAMQETIADIAAGQIDEDMLLRARQPLLESYANALAANNGWMGLVDRAQTQADRIDRFAEAPDIMRSITARRLQEVARLYLVEGSEVEVIVLPEEPGE